MTTTAEYLARPVDFDETPRPAYRDEGWTGDERRALAQMDEAQAQRDRNAAYSARLVAASDTAVKLIAEAFLRPDCPAGIAEALCWPILVLQAAKRTRAGDETR